MKEIRLTVINESGMHARPASLVVGAAAKFKAALTVSKGEREANLKSLLGLLGLGVCQHDQVVFRADGVDEEAALEAIVKCGQENGLWTL